MLQRFKTQMAIDSDAWRERLMQRARRDVVAMHALNGGAMAFVGTQGEAKLDVAGAGVQGDGEPVITGRNSARCQRTQESFDQSTGYGRSQRAARVRLCH